MVKTRYLLTFLSIFICFSNSGCLKFMAEQGKMEAPPLAVKFEPVRKQNITQHFETAGELKADREVSVSAESHGQVKTVLVREGDYVKKGQLLVQIKGEEVKSDLAMAKSDYEIYKKLAEEGAISRQEAFRYETDMKRFQARLNNLQIRAIFSGQIGQIYVDPGDFVNLGSKILDLVKNRPLRVTYSIPEKLIPKVKMGQEIEVTLDSYAQKTFKAYIDFISPRVNPQTRALLIRARLDDENKVLKANQFVKVKQKIEDIKDTLLVREESIYLDQGQQFLYKANLQEGKKDKRSGMQLYEAERIPVKTGLRTVDEKTDEHLVEILEGVEEGDMIIYAGLHSIYPGAELIDVAK